MASIHILRPWIGFSRTHIRSLLKDHCDSELDALVQATFRKRCLCSTSINVTDERYCTAVKRLTTAAFSRFEIRDEKAIDDIRNILGGLLDIIDEEFSRKAAGRVGAKAFTSTRVKVREFALEYLKNRFEKSSIKTDVILAVCSIAKHKVTVVAILRAHYGEEIEKINRIICRRSFLGRTTVDLESASSRLLIQQLVTNVFSGFAIVLDDTAERQIANIKDSIRESLQAEVEAKAPDQALRMGALLMQRVDESALRYLCENFAQQTYDEVSRESFSNYLHILKASFSSTHQPHEVFFTFLRETESHSLYSHCIAQVHSLLNSGDELNQMVRELQRSLFSDISHLVSEAVEIRRTLDAEAEAYANAKKQIWLSIKSILLNSSAIAESLTSEERAVLEERVFSEETFTKVVEINQRKQPLIERVCEDATIRRFYISATLYQQPYKLIIEKRENLQRSLDELVGIEFLPSRDIIHEEEGRVKLKVKAGSVLHKLLSRAENTQRVVTDILNEKIAFFRTLQECSARVSAETLTPELERSLVESIESSSSSDEEVHFSEGSYIESAALPLTLSDSIWPRR